MRQDVDDEVLRAAGVHEAEADRQEEVRRVVVEAQRRQRRLPLLEANLRDVHLGDEELHPHLHVRPEQRLGARGDLVVLLVQPRVEAPRVLRAQDEDVVLTD
jgi:hypothetical protein